jgi:hypothetical protein
MAKDEEEGEIKEKDFAAAVRYWRHDIKKANTDAATSNKDASDGYKAIKKHCHIQPDAARKAFKLMDGTEDAKRDDWFRCFVGVVNEMAGAAVLTFHSSDLVDQMEAGDGLATLADDEDDEDGMFGGEDDDLLDDEPEPGTGAAAIAAMKRGRKTPAPALN